MRHRSLTSLNIVVRLLLPLFLVLILSQLVKMPKKLSKQPTASSSSSTTSSTATFANPSLPRCFTDGGPLPKAIVFDLDYTLWPFWVDTHPYPPFRANQDHTSTTDKSGETYTFYPDVPAILHALSTNPIKLGVASRTHAPDLAKDLLKQLWIYPAESSGNKSSKKPRKALEVFDSGMMEIYPSSKIRHFESLHKKTQVAYADMLFFDDESRNREVESLGVTMWLVRDGVSWREVERGVLEWRGRRAVGNGTAGDGKAK